ncbi:MAG: tetratricopeptide repeat protein [Marinibacterium sp.]|nr:tetratricopeptide repeat protein [Marinibacterium sp.]
MAQAEPTTAVAAEQIEARFLVALDALDRGDPQFAIRELTAILALDPGLIRVRLELARAYFEAEEWARARQEFFVVLSADIPDEVRSNVLIYIRAIDARRGVEWNARIALARLGDARNYDTDEIRLGFGGVELPFELERDSDTRLGLRGAVDVTLRAPLAALSGERAQALGFATLAADFEEGPGSDYDDHRLSAAAGLRYVRNRTTLDTALTAGTRFVRGDQYQDRVGLRVTGEHRWS